jgi:hypothetical protein
LVRRNIPHRANRCGRDIQLFLFEFDSRLHEHLIGRATSPELARWIAELEERNRKASLPDQTTCTGGGASISSHGESSGAASGRKDSAAPAVGENVRVISAGGQSSYGEVGHVLSTGAYGEVTVESPGGRGNGFVSNGITDRSGRQVVSTGPRNAYELQRYSSRGY